MPGHESTAAAAPLMVAGKPWQGCPGSLAFRPAVAQARRYAWHAEGRLGPAIARANPRLVGLIEAFVGGQMAARAEQHKRELERARRAQA